MSGRRPHLLVPFLVFLFAGSVGADGPKPNPSPQRVSMNNFYLGKLLNEMTREVKGEEGYWEFELYDVPMILVTDESHGRMRIMAPIVEAGPLDAAALRFLMEVNFDRALDAKYAIWQDTLFAVYVHPLNDLTESEVRDAVRQVANLQRTYGTTFSSTDVVLGGGDGGE